jgi:hypothetical protein
MGDASCARVRELLIDRGGNADALPLEARDHLASCRECSVFLGLLTSLAPKEGTPSPDYPAVDRALARARDIARRRKERADLVLFLCAAIGVSAVLVAAGALGFGLPILAFQGLAFLALPFAGYALLRRRTKEKSL